MADYVITPDGELMHYGVPGMKWGVIRSRRKANANYKLAKKAADLDKKAATLYKKAEKQHSKYDLEDRNKYAKKAGNYQKKAAKYEKKAVTTESDMKRDLYNSKAEDLKYKSAKARMTANRMSRTTGYGIKAMNTSIKSDKVAAKAAKARMKMANNTRYINAMNRKMDTLNPEDYRKVKEWMDRKAN